MTPQQEALALYADRADVRMSVIIRGLSERFKYIYSSKDLELIQSVIDNDLEPAVKLAERALKPILKPPTANARKPLVSNAPNPDAKNPKPAKAKT